MHDQLLLIVLYLAAAVVAVPIFQRFKLGAILGYLVAGVIIGPYVLGLVSDPAATLHLAEMGVVLLLFIIGLELSPATLWRMRNWILGLGSAQLGLTTLVISGLVLFLGSFEPGIALMVGLALALSSTAFAVQLMNDYRIFNTVSGRKGFAILLTQDLAVIPILLYVDWLAGNTGTGPAWWVGVLIVAAVLVAGWFLLNPFLRLISSSGGHELMTAAALLIVLGTALVIESAGLSMGMGAFIAGILLANSSFRHQLETEIEPFKGLLLGLFFIAIGMSMDLSVLTDAPLLIVSLAVALTTIKATIIATIVRISGTPGTDAIRLALTLSQGGEFAFVVVTQALSQSIIDPQLANQISIVVGISMAMTVPLLMIFNAIANRQSSSPDYDSDWDESEPEVIIAGFGRFGQITGRILSANGIRFTALDKDAEHIEFVKQFGHQVFYGDATRLDLLQTAGLNHARVLLVAIDDEEDALAVTQLVKDECPSIKVVARAHNRVNLLKQRQAGADYAIREINDSSLIAAGQVLQGLGMTEDRALEISSIFSEHDQGLIDTASDQPEVEMARLIKLGNEGRAELESLFNQDRDDILSSEE
ncbi:MAG: monovalent cation:proton antiporter-2 (CPA2) family protein [Pseudomonadota bacterium]